MSKKGNSKTILAVYNDPDEAYAGAQALVGKGIKIREIYSPFPIHGIDKVLKVKPTRVSTIAFFYGATGTYIGLGLPNTLAIITSAIVTGTTNMSSFAAGLANSYRGGENIDWFLPSKDELNLLYQAREKIGGFATNQTPGASPAYWSSTQKGGISFTNFTSFANGVTSARLQFFNTGGSPVQQAGTITDTGIDNPRRVRAIRIF